MTLLFYLCIDLIAVLYAILADKYINNEKRVYVQENNKGFFGLKMKRYQFYFFLSFLTLFLVVALRDDVGADYRGYSNAFLHINEGNLTLSEEKWLSIGYKILCIVIGIINPESYHLMFAIVGFITIYYFYKAIYKISSNWGMSIYIFICFCLYYQCFNQIRQMLAMAITTYAYRYIKEEKTIPYFVCIGIAILFHPSAIVMASVFIVQKWRMCFKNYCIYTIICIMGYFGFNIILELLSYTNYGQTYLQWTKYNTSFEMSSIINLGVRFILLIACLIFSKKTIARKPSTLGLYNAAIICTILQVFTLKSYLFGRITTYFFVMYIFLIPEVIITMKHHLKGNSYNLVKGLIFLVLLAYHFIYYFSSSGASGSGYTIYKSLLF